MTTANTATQHSPLLTKLSGELRNRIYRLSIKSHLRIDVVWRPEDRSHWRNGEPGLLRTCRQIRAETLAIYYGENKLEILSWQTDHLAGMESWFEMLGPMRAGMIRKFVHTGRIHPALMHKSMRQHQDFFLPYLEHHAVEAKAEKLVPHLERLVGLGLRLDAVGTYEECETLVTVYDLMEMQHRLAVRMAVRKLKGEGVREVEVVGWKGKIPEKDGFGGWHVDEGEDTDEGEDIDDASDYNINGLFGNDED